MSSSRNEGWPPSSQPPAPAQQSEQQPQSHSQPPPQQSSGYPSNGHQPPSQASSSASLLPRPPSPYHPGSGPIGPSSSFPSLSAVNNSSPAHRPSQPQDHSLPGHSSHSQQPQNAQLSLPGIHSGAPGQALSSQPQFDRDRDYQEARDREMREREMDAQARREQQDRDMAERDARHRQHDQAAPHQPPPPPQDQTPLYQPVAVGPQVRSAIHGPNGLLSNPAPQQTANRPISPASSQIPLFGPHMNEGTPRQHPAQLPPQAPVPFGTPQMQPAPGQQPILNDALSYLDQVKVQFSGNPMVYNQFLDIMKDFKSQTIDTPGVIRRVSQLFAGHPNLIQGFNTFLPPGYRIECGTDGNPNDIRVTTPMGHTVSPMGTSLDSRAPPDETGADLSSFNPRPAGDQWTESKEPHPDQHDPSVARSHEPRFGRARLSPMDQPQRDHGVSEHLASLQHEQKPPQFQGPGAPDPLGRPPAGRSVSPSARSAAGGGDGGQAAAAPTERKGPVEFNHAISYVNKIKNRFAQQPEIYKQFLEILQTYQRESKPIQDVYAQVTHLFNDAPDLLQDFKQFLPESAAHAKAAAVRQAAEDMTMTSNLRGGPDSGPLAAPSRHTPRPEQHRMPPVGNFAPTPSASRDVKRKRGDRQGPVGGVTTTGHDLGPPPPGTRTGFGPNKRAKHHQQPPARSQQQMEAPAVSPTLVPALPEPMAPQTSTAASAEELNFFERVKKSIGNKNGMTEFLKWCNLFSQDMLDKNQLVYRVQSFIGDNPELFNWFKTFVNYDGKNDVIENRPKPESGRLSLNNCRGYGPSYRLMPKVERLKVCSGRDELCHSVLNNNWVSHPTWASEDSGFIAHRKNVHEEALHRIEEERHDYDHHIAVCDRAIQILEPICSQIEALTTDAERAAFTMPTDLGGQTWAIFKRTLTKIYGRPNALQIVTMMPERPCSVIPVCLMRMRQKSEEWKLSQREWEKIWRDQTQRMFWRSLDHQGINAKMADKRQFQTKTLQNEIQVKFEEQRRIRQSTNKPEPKYQMHWTFNDQKVLIDASALLLMYSEAHYSSDVGRLTTLIKEFIPLFFGLDMETFQNRLQQVSGSSPASDEADEDAHVSDDSGASRGRRTNGRKPDLLRDVLEKGRKSARAEKEGSIASGSRASTPDVASTADQDMAEVAETVAEEVRNMTWIAHPVDGNVSKQREVKPNEPFTRNVFNLYANLPIYCFFRVFVILYERLLNIKQNESEVHETVRRAKMAKSAVDLKLIDKHPDNFFSDTSPTANYYEQMLGMLEQSLKRDDSIESGHIEEILRRYYLQSGWMLYQFEKMLAAIVRFGIAILGNESKERSSEILHLFLKDRRKESTTHQDELTYRKQVEKYVKDGDIYRIAYNPTSSVCTARILKHEETTFEVPEQDENSTTVAMHMDGVLTPEQRWNYYVASFRSLDPTEGVPQDRVAQPYIKRNLDVTEKAALASAAPQREEGNEAEADAANEETEDTKKSAMQARADAVASYENLRFRISVNTFKLEWSESPEKRQRDDEIEEWWMAMTLPKKRQKRSKKESDQDESAAPEDGGSTKATGASANVDGKNDETKEPEAAAHAREHEHEGEDNLALFEEKFVMNNKWMAGLSRDDVDTINKEYRDWIGGVGEGNNKETSDTAASSAPETRSQAAQGNTDGQEGGEDAAMTG